MSATGFHPEPSAKAPWTRTMVLTVAYAGDDTAKAAPVRRARIKRFMLQLHKIVPPHCFPRGTASRRLRLRGITAGIYGWRNGFRVTLHRNTTKLPMSALGQKRTLSDISAMSALPIAARSSQDFACWARATPSARSKYASAFWRNDDSGG